MTTRSRSGPDVIGSTFSRYRWVAALLLSTLVVLLLALLT
jgi:hypothetical protein